MVFNQSLWKESVNAPRGLNLRVENHWVSNQHRHCFCVDSGDRKPRAPEWLSLKLFTKDHLLSSPQQRRQQ